MSRSRKMIRATIQMIREWELFGHDTTALKGQLVELLKVRNSGY